MCLRRHGHGGAHTQQLIHTCAPRSVASEKRVKALQLGAATGSSDTKAVDISFRCGARSLGAGQRAAHAAKTRTQWRACQCCYMSVARS